MRASDGFAEGCTVTGESLFLAMGKTAPQSKLEATADFQLLAHDLALVEERISEVIRSREQRISTIADYLINAGGKRIRPAVSLLVFRACGGEEVSDMVDLCVALELIHTATLLHDDIIDSSDTRRGKEAAPLRFGVPDTLVTGDFLFCRAFDVCGRFEEKIVAWAAEACVALTEGEIMQSRFRRNPDATERDYLEIIDRKTASLFSAGARIGAHLAGLDDGAVESMADCGQNVGLAFQMIDDVLDVDGNVSVIGKQVGTDLRDGNPSLPIVWALDHPGVLEAFVDPHCGQPAIDQALEIIRNAGVTVRVRELATRHVERACRHISALPPSAFREQLLRLTQKLVARNN